jgi:hypothetical protein
MSRLTAESLAIIDDLWRSGPSAHGALPAALRLTQQERRRVDVEEVEYLVEVLDLSPVVVDGVARF